MVIARMSPKRKPGWPLSSNSPLWCFTLSNIVKRCKTWSMKAVKCRTCGERHALGPCPGQVIEHAPTSKPTRARAIEPALADDIARSVGQTRRRETPFVKAILKTNAAPLTVEHVKAAKKAVAGHDLDALDIDPAPMRVSALGTVYVAFRAPTGLLAQVDDIAKRSGDSRSRVLRRLVRIGLKGEQP